MNTVQAMQILKTLWFILTDKLAAGSRTNRLETTDVLLIRLDAIGDFVLWINMARALCDHYHAMDRHVVLLANKNWADWARSMSLADEVIEVDRKRLIDERPYRHELLRTIRQRRFKTVIQPVVARMLVASDLLVRITGAGERIGVAWVDSRRGGLVNRWRETWYTQLIRVDQVGRSEVRRNAAFASELIQLQMPAEPPLLPTPAVNVAQHQQPYAVLFPGASWAGRMWPTGNFAAIGRLLQGRGLHVIVAGGNSEASQCSELARELGDSTENRCGKTSLAELGELMRFSAVVVSNETSAIHIAAGVRAPAVCIVGGGHFGRFTPYDVDVSSETRHSVPISVFKKMDCFNCDWRCIYPRTEEAPVPCIAGISVASVWCEVEILLGPSTFTSLQIVKN
jgi:ADP-heptose:LPS heptosyltransferase